MPRLPFRIVLNVLLISLAAGSVSAQDDEAPPDLNGIWRTVGGSGTLLRMQQVDNVVTGRFLRENTISIKTGRGAEKGAPDTSSTFDSLKGEIVQGELTGQVNLYYYAEEPIPDGPERGWQFQDATFQISDDEQTIEFETEDKKNGGTFSGQYARVSNLPPPSELPEDDVDDRVVRLRVDVDVIIRNEYPHMEGRLILEEFRNYGGREYYLRVYEDSKTVTINGVQYVVVTRLICGFDDLNNRIVILIPWVDPEQPPEEVEPPPHPPLDLPRLNLPQDCMVVTNLKRLREVHGDDYDEVREFAESFGPVIDLGAHLEDYSDWQAADAVIEEQFNRDEYGCLFIFGDGGIVPFGVYENPLFGERKDEKDRIILSDDPYGDFDHDQHNTWDVMVARLPNDPDVLETVARRLAQPHEEETPQRHDFAVYGNANWPLSEILASLGSPDDPQLRWSEPHNENDFSDNFFDGRHVIINLHGGADDGSHYWGEVKREDGRGDMQTVVAMNVTQAKAPGAIVLSGCCYGALIDGKHAGSSIALQYLASGAEAYIGSTMINYIGQTDETSYGLWGRLFVSDVREGISPQEAFLQAKREYALSVEANPLTQFKTYHQMVYLGLPPMGEAALADRN